MKIYIKPRKFFLNIKGTKEEETLINSANIISIITPEYSPHNFTEEDPPFSKKYWNNPNILILKFHDAWKQVNNLVKLMSSQDADKIWKFCQNIDTSKPLYIHCTAGKSRSQAVGYIINLYFNHLLEDNVQDFREFEIENSSIRHMNILVKTLLSEKFLKRA